jgi:tetratricopeptide (TPR) repeat protein
MVLGDLDAAREHAELAFGIAREHRDEVAQGVLLSWTCVLPHWRGEFAQAIVDSNEAVAESGVTEGTVLTLEMDWFTGIAEAHRGNYERGLEYFQNALELCRRIGEASYPGRAMNSVGWIYGELQDHERALGWNRKSIEAAMLVNAPDPEIEANARLSLADSLVALGRLDEADEELRWVERIVEHPTSPERWALWRYSQHWAHSAGELALVRGDITRAEALAIRCLEIAESTSSRKNIVKARRLRGQARMALGDLPAAESDIAAALELAIEIGNPGQIWKTHEALGDLRLAQGRPDDACAAYRAALAVLDGVADSLIDDELRTTLLGSAVVQRLRAATA